MSSRKHFLLLGAALAAAVVASHEQGRDYLGRYLVEDKDEENELSSSSLGSWSSSGSLDYLDAGEEPKSSGKDSRKETEDNLTLEKPESGKESDSDEESQEEVEGVQQEKAKGSDSDKTTLNASKEDVQTSTSTSSKGLKNLVDTSSGSDGSVEFTGSDDKEEEELEEEEEKEEEDEEAGDKKTNKENKGLLKPDTEAQTDKQQSLEAQASKKQGDKEEMDQSDVAHGNKEEDEACESCSDDGSGSDVEQILKEQVRHAVDSVVDTTEKAVETVKNGTKKAYQETKELVNGLDSISGSGSDVETVVGKDKEEEKGEKHSDHDEQEKDKGMEEEDSKRDSILGSMDEGENIEVKEGIKSRSKLGSQDKKIDEEKKEEGSMDNLEQVGEEKKKGEGTTNDLELGGKEQDEEDGTSQTNEKEEGKGKKEGKDKSMDQPEQGSEEDDAKKTEEESISVSDVDLDTKSQGEGKQDMEETTRYSHHGNGEVGDAGSDSSFDEREKEEEEDFEQIKHFKGWVSDSTDNVANALEDASEDVKSAGNETTDSNPVPGANTDEKKSYGNDGSTISSDNVDMEVASIAVDSVGSISCSGSRDDTLTIQQEQLNEKSVGLIVEKAEEAEAAESSHFIKVGAGFGAFVGIIAVAFAFIVRKVRSRSAGALSDEATVAMKTDVSGDGGSEDELAEAGALDHDDGDQAREAEEEGKFVGSV